MHFSCRFYKKLNNNKQHAASSSRSDAAAKSATLAERLKAGNVQRAAQTAAGSSSRQQTDPTNKTMTMTKKLHR